MTSKEIRDLIKLLDQADLVTLHYGERKAALGEDMVIMIMNALELELTTRDDSP